MKISNRTEKFKKISVDQLPSYTNWPQILINSQKDVLYSKTKDNIFREYESDKWGAIYQEIKNKSFSVDDVDEMQFKDPGNDMACSVGEGLFAAPPLQVKLLLVDIIDEAISEVVAEGDNIIELGAGTGSIILRLAKMDKYKASKFYAADFSNSSLNIISHLAAHDDVNVNLQLLDFNSEIFDISIPKNSIVYISFALCLIENINLNFWRKLMAFSPKAIIIAEPIFDFYEDRTILGLLQRRYYLANQYSTDIYSSIIESTLANIFKVKKITKNVIGINPLIPVSLIHIA